MPRLKGPVPQVQAKEGPMPQLVKKRRSGWAVLGLVALVASLLAAGATPAAAVPHQQDVTPEFSACVGAAGVHDPLFSDVSEMSVHRANINCIAYYGITVGKGDGTFAPDEHVRRSQMEAFVTRTANLAGVDAEAVLEDVMLSDLVTRAEMATLMFGFLHDLLPWVRVNDRTGDIEFDRDDDDIWAEVDDYFADARNSVPIAVSDMIGASYELGVTVGTNGMVGQDGTFDPFGLVTRAQMASFIVRALDHSNVRPEGLSAQKNNDDETQIAVRDAGPAFAPIANSRVDVFSSLYADSAFDDDDECVGRFVKDETSSFGECEIDIGDQLSDDDGNVQLTLDSDMASTTATCLEGEGVGGGVGPFVFETADTVSRTFWAWTGGVGDEVDDDTDLVEVEEVDRRRISSVGTADHADVSGGNADISKMGETVNFTVQLQDIKDNAARTDRSRNAYVLTITKHYVRPDPDGSDTGITADDRFEGYDFTDVGGTEVEASAASAFSTPFDRLVFPEDDGSYEFSLTHADRRSTVDDAADVAVEFKLTPFGGDDETDENPVKDITASGENVYIDAVGESAIGFTVFSDDDPVQTTVAAESASYRLVNPPATSNSVTVTVKDQYGDPVRNARITVSSDLDTAGTDTDQVRYPEEVDITVQVSEDSTDVIGSFATRRNGQYSIGYAYTGNTAQTEMITPTVNRVLGVGDDPTTTDLVEPADHEFQLQPELTGDPVNVYWVETGLEVESTVSGSEVESVLVRVPDVSNRLVVANEGADDGDEPHVYYYDDADSFIVGEQPASLAMFEEALSATAKTREAYPERVIWESYDYVIPNDRAIWTLTMRCVPHDPQ